MKKLLALLLFAFTATAGNVFAGIVHYNSEVTLSTTTGTMVDKIRLNRRYFLIQNISFYDVLCSTFQQKTGETTGLVIPNNYGYWEEDFYCFVSSYYAIALSSGAAGPVKVKISVKE